MMIKTAVGLYGQSTLTFKLKDRAGTVLSESTVM